MKTSTGVLERIDKEELNRMTEKIKKTPSTGISVHHKTFSHVDLWNIQRRRKSVQSRKNYLATGN